MLALATVVEIDNRSTRQRFKLLIAKPRARLLADLREALDPETGGGVVSDDGEAIDACVLVDAWGAIRVVIHPGETTGTVARLPGLDTAGLDSEEQRELFIEAAHEDRHIVGNLAENLLRFMERGDLTIEVSGGTGRHGAAPVSRDYRQTSPGGILRRGLQSGRTSRHNGRDSHART